MRGVQIEDGVVVIRPADMWTPAQARAQQAEAARILGANGIRSVLVDMRGIHHGFSTLDIHEFNTRHREAFPPGTRHAVVVSGATIPPADARFAENVAVNRGVSLKVFTDIDEALRWLHRPRPG